MRILIEPSYLHRRNTALPEQTQRDIHDLRMFASELLEARDMASASIVLTFADMLEDGASWDAILDDAPIVGMYRQTAPTLTIIQ